MQLHEKLSISAPQQSLRDYSANPSKQQAPQQQSLRDYSANPSKQQAPQQQSLRDYSANPSKQQAPQQQSLRDYVEAISCVACIDFKKINAMGKFKKLIYIILTISTVIFSCYFYKSYKKQTNKIYDNKVTIQSKLLELNKIKNIYINIQTKEKITNKNKKSEKLITSLQPLQTKQINLFENIINKITKDLKNNIKISKWKSETNLLTITGIATNYKYLASLSYILKKHFSHTKIIKTSESEKKYLINFIILATN